MASEKRPHLKPCDAEEIANDQNETPLTMPTASRNFQQNPPVQHYRPAGSCEEAQALLEQDDLTQQDVVDFFLGKTQKLKTQSDAKKQQVEVEDAIFQAVQERRTEIRELATKLWEGEAFVDDMGRLVPVIHAENTNLVEGNVNNGNHHRQQQNIQPAAAHPPLQQDNPAADNNPNVNVNNNGNGNLLNINFNPNILLENNNLNINNNNNLNIPFPLDREEEERRWTEQEEREAAEAIARVVQRYRQAGVPEQEFVLIKVPPTDRPERANLTFRRICFAVLAVVTAFLCILLQTIPLFPKDFEVNPIFDKLLYELLEVRHFHDHVKACPNLHRSPPAQTRSWMQRAQAWLQQNQDKFLQALSFSDREQSSSLTDDTVNCHTGVLHIPSKSVIMDSFFESSGKGDKNTVQVLAPYMKGVNVSWFLPCHRPPHIPTKSNSKNNQCAALPPEDSCIVRPDQSPQQLTESCFRGIHDNIVLEKDVAETLRFGAELIDHGGDHFDIHDDEEMLQMLRYRLPTLLETIHALLRDTYRVRQPLQPVAFRISAVGPLDGRGVALYGDISESSSYLLRILNRHRYMRWIERKKRHNELARYSMPWPVSRSKPYREPCHMLADLEADPQFDIHTSIFLSSGAGGEFRGGASLFVDDHSSNENPRRKIQRGVTIDGSRGRLVVSTGGYENRRCRLPTREGIRAALQIWWSCDE